MTEVRWYREEILGIIHILGKQLAIHGFILQVKSTNHNGHNFHRITLERRKHVINSLSTIIRRLTPKPVCLPMEHFDKIRQMHLHAMFCFIYMKIHKFKLPCCPELVIDWKKEKRNAWFFNLSPLIWTEKWRKSRQISII